MKIKWRGSHEGGCEEGALGGPGWVLANRDGRVQLLILHAPGMMDRASFLTTVSRAHFVLTGLILCR